MFQQHALLVKWDGLNDMKFVCDDKRHLICVPYSLENLHAMAEELGIAKCWFHKNHYDIPKKRIDEIKKKCTVVDTKNIVEIIRSPQYAETIISDLVPRTGAIPRNQVLPEHEVLKFNGNSTKHKL